MANPTSLSTGMVRPLQAKSGRFRPPSKTRTFLLPRVLTLPKYHALSTKCTTISSANAFASSASTAPEIDVSPIPFLPSALKMKSTRTVDAHAIRDTTSSVDAAMSARLTLPT